MNTTETYAALLTRGYSASQADLAMTRALTRGRWDLSRHIVSHDGEGYRVTPLPWDGDGMNGAAPAQQIAGHAPEELDWLLHAVGTVDRWLDAEVAGAYKDQPLAQDWARVCKGAEEQGESVAELILATGQNPRKGTDPDARDRLLAELADTAVTAIFAIQHFTKDPARTWAVVTKAVAKAYDRAPEVYR